MCGGMRDAGEVENTGYGMREPFGWCRRNRREGWGGNGMAPTAQGVLSVRCNPTSVCLGDKWDLRHAWEAHVVKGPKKRILLQFHFLRSQEGLMSLSLRRPGRLCRSMRRQIRRVIDERGGVLAWIEQGSGRCGCRVACGRCTGA